MTLLDVRGIRVRRAGRLIVDGASFTVAAGELVALMGPSGSGKSTVLRAVGGLDPLDGGEVLVESLRLAAGRPPRGEESRRWHRHVGLVFQFHHLFAHLSALDNVCLAPIHALGVARDEAARRARELLAMVGVEERAHAHPHELSGGEAQRVAIARALAVDPRVLLLDEPTASLDEARRDELAEILRALAASGRAVLLSTHDAPFARRCADRSVAIDAGRVVDPVELTRIP